LSSFRDVADLVDSGSAEFDQVARVASAYGLHFSEAEWLPDVIARYGLTPPSGS
jgi:hypothetical protein